jgi:SAM-dependent methyltransferase
MQFLGNIPGKNACVLASGDNEVVFALAGMGAKVTSVDISEGQIATAKERADTLGLDISFLRADITNLAGILEDNTFDIVHTGGGVACWISDLRKYYAEGVRILKPGGFLIINEFHPFKVLLINEEPMDRLHDYFDRGPFTYTSNEGFPGTEHHWPVSDRIHAVLDTGCDLLKVDEHDGTESDCLWDKLDEKKKKNIPKKVDGIKVPRYLLIVGRKR